MSLWHILYLCTAGVVGYLCRPILKFIADDIGNTLSSLPGWLLMRAVDRAPPHLRERLLEEWQAEIPYLLPSKLAHLRFALGCYRFADSERRRFEIEQAAATDQSNPQESREIKNPVALIRDHNITAVNLIDELFRLGFRLEEEIEDADSSHQIWSKVGSSPVIVKVEKSGEIILPPLQKPY